MLSATASGLLKETYAVTVGQQIGSYRIERLVDEGGMGAVFEAIHPEIGRRAAVKVLRRTFARDPEFAARFLNEARAANLVGHPNIVEVFEFGRLSDETPYIIMEFLAGRSLAARLREQPAPSLAESLEWCRQIAHAMTAAHQKGIIHRDLKPENVFLVPDPVHSGGLRIKILDFGIAKLRPEQSVGGASVTRAGTTMGSPAYMAPEQCYELGLVTERADVYALGIILYELLAGRPPFIADLTAEVLVMQAKVSPPPLRQLAPAVPIVVATLVHQLLEKKPENRPTMAELLAKLTDLQATLPLATKRAGGPGLQTRGSQVPTQVLALLTVVCVLGAGLVLRQLMRQPPRATPQANADAGAAASTTGQTVAKSANPAGQNADTVRCEISSEPSGVQIFDAQNDRLLGTTPTTLNLQRNPQAQKVVLRKAGYQDRTVSLDRTRDVVRSESLLPAPRKVRSPGTGTSPASTNPSGTSQPASPKTKPGKDELLAPSL